MRQLLQLALNIKDWANRSFGNPDYPTTENVVLLYGHCVAMPTVYCPSSWVLNNRTMVNKIRHWRDGAGGVLPIVGCSGTGKTLLALSLCASDSGFAYWCTYADNQPKLTKEQADVCLIVDEVQALTRQQKLWLINWQLGGGKLVICCQDIRMLPKWLSLSEDDSTWFCLEQNRRNRFDYQEHAMREITALVQ